MSCSEWIHGLVAVAIFVGTFSLGGAVPKTPSAAYLGRTDRDKTGTNRGASQGEGSQELLFTAVASRGQNSTERVGIEGTRKARISR